MLFPEIGDVTWLATATAPRREYRPTDEYRPAGLSAARSLGEITATEMWLQIITVAQSDRLRAMLTSPDRRAAGQAAPTC